MADRRRINGPSCGTAPPLFTSGDVSSPDTKSSLARTRAPNVIRKIFLKTGVTPSASGSAYLECESQPKSSTPKLSSLSSSGLKISCTVHGPRPLPRSAPFSPHVVLAAHVKYAPFATRKRRGYLRDPGERDLAMHLETALRGVIIGDRWPKSGVDVVITILEGEEDQWWEDDNQPELGPTGQWGMMNVLSGCITVASAAISDAGIDCVDMVSGGVAAVVRDRQLQVSAKSGALPQPTLVLDPVPSEHSEILAACVVGYLPSRDEITDLWAKGDFDTGYSEDGNSSYDSLSENAIEAAKGSYRVLDAALKDLDYYAIGSNHHYLEMTPGGAMINEPVPISRIAGRYLVFDINVVTYLRRTHHICGVLIGSIPQVPQQNVFLGLPLELLPEEARLLVEKEVAYIVDDASQHRETFSTLVGDDRRKYLDSLRSQGRKSRRAAEEVSQKKIEKGLAKQALLRASKDTLQSTVTKSSTEPTDVTSFSSISPSEESLFPDHPSLPTASTPSVPSSAPYPVTTTTTTSSVLPLSQGHIQQPDPVVPASYALFCHLHSLDYFMTPGLRFGCDYTVYPGDPLRFHSHFLAVGHDWEEEIPLIDLVGGGRLGTGVKKGFLIGGEGPGAQGKNVRPFCIEWGGM
ncbi:hypothetical protein V496_01140 [Pseudogymnoascus sp. VKM F-4515 (FW-2607)]|nr:hypothetical protein V496_01140 [Pseudogymnoascus sp. VKM F-4515 (FW-2607)]